MGVVEPAEVPVHQTEELDVEGAVELPQPFQGFRGDGGVGAPFGGGWGAGKTKYSKTLQFTIM